MILIQGEGSRVTKGLRPANTSVAVLYTVEGAVGAHFEAINVACNSAADATVWYNDGTTDFLLFPVVTMAAKEFQTMTFGNLALKQGWSIKVQASVADAITFVATVAEYSRTTRAQPVR